MPLPVPVPVPVPVKLLVAHFKMILYAGVSFNMSFKLSLTVEKTKVNCSNNVLPKCPSGRSYSEGKSSIMLKVQKYNNQKPPLL